MIYLKTALHQKRPYLDLIDVLNAIKTVIDKKLFKGEIYNVLTKNLTVNDILKIIKKEVPNVKIVMTDSDIMNQYSYEVSAEKFKTEGFKVSGNENHSIIETIKLLSNANSFLERN